MLDDRFKSGDSILLERIRSIMCVPLATQKKILGVIYVDNRGLGGAYQERDLELLAAIGKQAGIAIERAMLHEETKKRLTSAVSSLVAALEAASPATLGHSARVAAVSVQIARQLELPEDVVEKVRLTALLHDIGKVLLPRELLEKPGSLRPEEREWLKAHAVAGARIAATIHGIGEVVDGVRSHHEHFDGQGYPEGLKGDGIPMMARIVGVADAYDAMSQPQPFRQAMAPEAVRSELEAQSSKQFDPAIVAALLALLEEDRLSVPPAAFTAEALLS
jgi:putative nucleotidyltransferase with HDIG domain